jgi:hypothetical protein
MKNPAPGQKLRQPIFGGQGAIGMQTVELDDSFGVMSCIQIHHQSSK